MTGQSTGMPVKVIIVALGVLLATIVIAALVATITTRAALSHSEGDQQYSPSETASVDTPRAGICGRTPEVQERLIEDLKIASCRVINADELYRVRKFSVGFQTVAPGDFADMPNLRVLGLSTGESGLPAGIFEGLTGLELLTINTPTSGPTEPLPHGTFSELSNLKQLSLQTGAGWIQLDPETLAGLSNLEVLALGSVDSIAPDTFAMVPALRALEFRYPEGAVLPTGLIQDLPELRRVEISGAIWPDTVAVASLETVCALSYGGQWERNSTVFGETPTLTVNGEAAKIILSDTRAGQIYCTIEHGQNEPKLAVSDVA